jgi:LysM repeat protein
MKTNQTMIKRRLAVLALVVVLAAASAVYAIPAQAQGIPGCPILITMFDTLYVRATPSYGAAVSYQLKAADVVCMIGRNGNSSWVQLAWPAPTSTVVGWGPASAFTTTVPITVLPVTDGSTPTTPPVTPPPVTPPPVTPPASGQTYVVKAGDGLYRIAQMYGVSWPALAQLNNVQPPAYVIYVGQVLAIPGTGTPTVPAGYTQYVVKQGDYLVSIARQYNKNWYTLATVNGIVAPWIIYPGQTLLIPATG